MGLGPMSKAPDAWLDRHIAEQAAYYGLTVAEFARRSAGAARLQEIADFNGWEADPRPDDRSRP